MKKNIFNLKFIIIFLGLILIFPIFLYFVEHFDLLTKLNITYNADKSLWLSAIFTYISAIFGALIGAISLVFMTKQQIEQTFKFERDQQLESKRIEILPCIEYKFNTLKEITNDCLVINFDSNKQQNDCNEIILEFNLTNIGIGAARNLSFGVETKIESSYFGRDIFKIGDLASNQVTILFSKDDIEEKKYKQCKKIYDLSFHTYYQDMIYNSYHQLVDISIELNYCKNDDGSSNYMNFVRINKIHNEESIKELPCFKFRPFVELIDIPIEESR